MYINQIKSDYAITNRGVLNSSKKSLVSNKNKVAEKIKQNSPIPPNEPGTWKEKIQRFAKKLSDAMLKILDTL